MPYQTIALQTPPSIASIPWVRWFKADAITPQSDNTALSSWVDSAGSGDPYTQSSSGAKPVYRTGANGINGVPVVQFAGSQYMSTAAGGASLSGSWYAAFVGVSSVNFAGESISGYSGEMAVGGFGDSAQYKRRSIMIQGGYQPNPEQTPGALFFNGYSSDIYSNKPLVQNVPFFIEMSFDGTFIKISINGVTYNISALVELLSYSSTAITIGARNPDFSSPFTGSIAENFYLNSVPTAAQLQAIRSYVQTKYAITTLQNGASVVMNGSTANIGAIGEYGGMVNFFDPIAAGGAPIMTGNDATVAGIKYPAAFSFPGAIAAYANYNSNHLLAGNTSGNILTIQNTGPFVAIRCLNFNWNECGAVGYANPGSPGYYGGDVAGGGFYIEASNFDPAYPYEGGVFSFVQTGSALSNQYALRYRWTSDGKLTYYDGSTANSGKGNITRVEHPDGSIDFYGTTSGTVTLRAAATAGTSTVFQLPNSNGTNGYFLQTDGSGNTSWVAASGSGTVTSIVAGTGLSGGTITTTGTLSLNLSHAQTWLALQTFSTSTISITGGTNAYVLSTDGSGNLSWVAQSGGGGSGTVTSVATGAGLTGGTITTSGTLSLDLTHANTFTAAQGVNVSSATGFFVGPNGTTNPTLLVVTNTGSAATGVSITSAAAGSGITFQALSSGTDESIYFLPKGAGRTFFSTNLNARNTPGIGAGDPGGNVISGFVNDDNHTIWFRCGKDGTTKDTMDFVEYKQFRWYQVQNNIQLAQLDTATGFVLFQGKLNLGTSYPTSSSGLPSGSIWVDTTGGLNILKAA